MKHALGASTGGIDSILVRDICFDNVQPRVALVLLKIGAPADDEAIEDAHMPALVDQAIDEVASDEACAPSYQIDQNVLADERPALPSTIAPSISLTQGCRPEEPACFCLHLLPLDFKMARWGQFPGTVAGA